MRIRSHNSRDGVCRRALAEAQVSRNIAAGRLSEVEGGFLSNQHLKDICFDVGEQIIHSSLTDTGFTLSMFRLRG
jgi:hypothetical protein